MDAIVQCHAYVKLRMRHGNEEKLKCYSNEAIFKTAAFISAFIQMSIENPRNVYQQKNAQNKTCTTRQLFPLYTIKRRHSNQMEINIER